MAPFYVSPNITKTGWPSKKLADALLEDTGVAALSGTAFGDFGEGYLRFSVANSIDSTCSCGCEHQNFVLWRHSASVYSSKLTRKGTQD